MKIPQSTWRTEATSLWTLAVPVVVVQIGMMAMGVVDTMMVGRVSAQALAAVALGNLYSSPLDLRVGFLLALDPLVAQAVGAGDDLAVRAGGAAGPAPRGGSAVPLDRAAPAGPVLRLLGQPAAIVPTPPVRAHAPGCCRSSPSSCCARPCRRWAGPGRSCVIVVANVPNAGLDWVLVFGRLGFPAWGPLGSAWRRRQRWLMAFGLLVVGWKALARCSSPSGAKRSRWPRCCAWSGRPPIGVQFQLEFAAFGVIALLMGWLGPGDGGAPGRAQPGVADLHGAAGGLGGLRGPGRPRGGAGGPRGGAALRGRRVPLGRVHGLCGALVSGPRPARAPVTGDEVAALAATLIPIAGFFQVFDGLQVVATGILRGLGDTQRR